MKSVVWFSAIVFWIFLAFNSALTGAIFFSSLFVTMILSAVVEGVKTKSVEKELDDEIKERIDRVMKETAERLKKAGERMEREAERETRRPPPLFDEDDAGVVKMTREVIVEVRNNLMKHHESKATDKDYQNSKMYKQTLSIIQTYNKALEKRVTH